MCEGELKVEHSTGPVILKYSVVAVTPPLHQCTHMYT